MGVFHKAMGDSMEISFDRSSRLIQPDGKTGLHFYRELDTWAKEYEKT